MIRTVPGTVCYNDINYRPYYAIIGVIITDCSHFFKPFTPFVYQSKWVRLIRRNKKFLKSPCPKATKVYFSLTRSISGCGKVHSSMSPSRRDTEP